MDFEQLKKEIDNSIEGEKMASPDLLASNGNDPVNSIRQSMRQEVVIQFLLILFFIGIFWLPIWKGNLNQGVYLISMVITASLTMGFIIKLTRFLMNSSDFSASSRNVLKDFIYEAKLTLSSYEAFVFAACALLPLPTFALLSGPNVFRKWITLQISPTESIYLVLGYSIYSCINFYVTRCWANWLYGRQLRRLEDLVEKLDDQAL